VIADQASERAPVDQQTVATSANLNPTCGVTGTRRWSALCPIRSGLASAPWRAKAVQFGAGTRKHMIYQTTLAISTRPIAMNTTGTSHCPYRSIVEITT
jgi:hypothetical protein